MPKVVVARFDGERLSVEWSDRPRPGRPVAVVGSQKLDRDGDEWLPLGPQWGLDEESVERMIAALRRAQRDQGCDPHDRLLSRENLEELEEVVEEAEHRFDRD